MFSVIDRGVYNIFLFVLLVFVVCFFSLIYTKQIYVVKRRRIVNYIKDNFFVTMKENVENPKLTFSYSLLISVRVLE